jgi:hypothetical protein
MTRRGCTTVTPRTPALTRALLLVTGEALATMQAAVPRNASALLLHRRGRFLSSVDDQDLRFMDHANASVFTKVAPSSNIVPESKCQDYTSSMPKHGSATKARGINAAFKCREGGFLALQRGFRRANATLLGRDWSMVISRRGQQRALGACLEVVPHAIHPEDVSAETRLRGGVAEMLFTLRFRARIDGGPGGFLRIVTPPEQPPWVATAMPEGGEDHLFRITCSHDDEGQWVHLQHAKTRAYVNCLGGKHVRAHGTPPRNLYAARREASTGMAFVPCPHLQEESGYLAS